MQKPKGKPPESGKKKEATAPIEFVVPYDLKDCVLRVRDTRAMHESSLVPGFEPSFEHVEPGVYRFLIKRTWYDYRSRRFSALVELHGYLKALDDGSTVVIATPRLRWPGLLMMAFIIGLLAAAFYFEQGRPSGLAFLIPVGLILLVYIITAFFDRRALIRRLYRAMSDDA